MGPSLPLFPLNTVLFPGLVLPLHVFEPRYRALIRHLMSKPDNGSREFGVVAIQRGWEVEQVAGAAPADPGRGDQVPVAGVPAGPVSLHEVGCSAQLRQVTEHPDGRFEVVTVGRQRFRIVTIKAAAPYLVADVEYLPDSVGDPDVADRLAPRVLAVFRRYLALIQPGSDQVVEQLPEQPTVLSHLVAAAAHLTVDDRQHLLAQPDTVSRLRAELTLISREAALLRRVRAVPASLADLVVSTSPN